jgi:hypothetical protein
MQRDNFVTLGQATKTVDITKHEFAVALSFPGEVRGIVEQVAQELEKLIGPNSYFYDRNDVSQLARPSQDILLQEFGNGGAIPASRLRGPFLVSRF